MQVLLPAPHPGVSQHTHPPHPTTYYLVYFWGIVVFKRIQIDNVEGGGESTLITSQDLTAEGQLGL